MKNKVKVIMLPNEKANDGNSKQLLYSDTMKDYAYEYQSEAKSQYYQTQHLYLLSDEETKGGDWFINLHDKSLGQYGYDQVPPQSPWVLKVVATTDKSLTEDVNSGKFYCGNIACKLPQIPESFIKYFVEKNGKVDEVEVEYESSIVSTSTNPQQADRDSKRLISELKLTDNNEVIIHLPEEPEIGLRDISPNYNIDDIIDFAEWYSGMDRDKVGRAYRRYLKEKTKKK